MRTVVRNVCVHLSDDTQAAFDHITMPDAHDDWLELDEHYSKSLPKQDCGLAKRYSKSQSHLCAHVSNLSKCPACIPAFHLPVTPIRNEEGLMG